MSEPSDTPLWHIRRGPRQLGPLTWSELSALSAASQVSASDELSSDGQSWRPAAAVPGLPFGAASPTTSALNYDAPRERPTVITGYGCDMLAQTSPYVRIISVLMFIGAALMVIGGVLIGVVGTVGGRTAAAGVGFAYIAFAALYVIPATYLAQYATNSRIFGKLRDGRALEKALQSQKSFWKFTGITALIVILLYILIFVFVIVAAVLTRHI